VAVERQGKFCGRPEVNFFSSGEWVLFCVAIFLPP